MAGTEQHDIAACARAWQTLRLAHDRVAARLAAVLDDECGLSLSEFDVLLYLHLHRNDEVQISALLEATPLSQPALSRLVTRLTARGLIARAATPHDRRACVVCLTAAGTTLIERAIELHARTVHEVFTSRLSAADQAALLRALSQVGR
jgi:DNA-binding MarR family transcriptional regulator